MGLIGENSSIFIKKMHIWLVMVVLKLTGVYLIMGSLVFQIIEDRKCLFDTRRKQRARERERDQREIERER